MKMPKIKHISIVVIAALSFLFVPESFAVSNTADIDKPAKKMTRKKTTAKSHSAKKTVAKRKKTATKKIAGVHSKGKRGSRKHRASARASLGPTTYIAKKGDTTEKLAKKFRFDLDEFKTLNDIGDDGIKPGRKLYLSRTFKESDMMAIVKEKQMNEDMKAVSSTPGLDLSEKLILIAQMMLDVPYKFGGNTFRGIDCSAYVQKVFSLANILLPRAARQQFLVGQAVDKTNLNVGDLVFFRTYAKFPSHVGIYLGDNLFIHASSRGKRVTVDSLEMPYYVKHFIGAKRLLKDEESDDLSDEITVAESK